jgi:hypothetical protein
MENRLTFGLISCGSTAIPNIGKIKFSIANCVIKFGGEEVRVPKIYFLPDGVNDGKSPAVIALAGRPFASSQLRCTCRTIGMA